MMTEKVDMQKQAISPCSSGSPRTTQTQRKILEISDVHDMVQKH